MTKDNKKIISYFIITLLISIFIGLIDMVWSNKTVIRKNKSYSPEILEMNNIYENNGKYVTTSDESYITVRTSDESYINKIKFNYSSDSNFMWEISYLNGEEEVELKYSSSSIIDSAIKKVSIDTQEFKIKFLKSDVTFSNIEIDNNIYINYSRFFVLVISIYVLFILLKFINIFKNNMHYTFLFIGIIFGVLMIISTSKVVGDCYDDNAHLKNSYSVFSSESFKANKAFMINESMSLTIKDYFSTQEEKKMFYKKLNKESSEVVNVQLNQYSLKYNKLIYIPYYVGLKISSLLKLNYTNSLLLARLLNYAVYLLLIYYAIKLSTNYKNLLFILGLSATRIFYGVQFTYDSIIIGCLMFAFSLYLEIISSDKINKKYVIAFILAVIWASLPKAIYAPFLLLLLFIPNNKFDNSNQSRKFKLNIIVLELVLLSTFMLPIISGSSSGGDIRGGDVSLYGQLSYILHNPIFFLVLMVKYLVYDIPGMVLGGFQFLGIGYLYTSLDKIFNTLYIIYLILILYTVFTNQINNKNLNYKYKILFSVFALMFFVGIPFTMYLIYTPVGLPHINGVQQRYFYQLLLPLFIILTPTIKEDIKPKNSKGIIIIGTSLLLFVTIFIMTINSVGL